MKKEEIINDMSNFEKELIELMKKYNMTLSMNHNCQKLWMGLENGCKFEHIHYIFDEDGVSKLYRFSNGSVGLAQISMEANMPL